MANSLSRQILLSGVLSSWEIYHLSDCELVGNRSFAWWRHLTTATYAAIFVRLHERFFTKEKYWMQMTSSCKWRHRANDVTMQITSSCKWCHHANALLWVTITQLHAAFCLSRFALVPANGDLITVAVKMCALHPLHIAIVIKTISLNTLYCTKTSKAPSKRVKHRKTSSNIVLPGGQTSPTT